MERVAGVARLISGRRTKWIVLGVWLVLFMGLSPLSGELTGVQKNDIAQWLPGSAESTQVVELQKQFQPTEVAPAVVVYERPSGTTPADLEKVKADVAKFAGVDGIAGEVSPPVEAKDGQALQVVVPVKVTTDDPAKALDRVKAIRAIASAGDTGLTVHIAGPLAFTADNVSAFEGADFTLMFATVLVVVVLLLVIYRSPVLWLLPVISAMIALVTSEAVIYLLAKNAGVTATGESSSILTVLVFGATTDYALLLIARYREALRRHEDRHAAMAVALRRAAPAIVASAATVAIGMLCLLFADMNSTSGLGPVAAVGIAVGLLVAVTLLPALLVICGRWLFWPKKPQVGSAEPSAHGVWARLGERIARRPRTVWIGTALVLGVMALGLTQLNVRILSAEDTFVTEQPSISAMKVLSKHFPAGSGEPVVVVGKADSAAALKAGISGTAGVVDVTEPVVKNGLALIEGTLQAQPGSAAADDTIVRLRAAVHAVAGADAKVGGPTAMSLDMDRATKHDNRLIIPLVLVVVLLILCVLLRAIVAPLLLMATVVLSFGAALGVSTLVFEHVFGFAGVDSSFPLYVFVFLVALGIDYNIFLVTRVREEALRIGTRRGALVGLAVTGGVITSAGLVLAATFGVLASLPLVFLAEMGFAVALGVLLDTFIVRSVLVTALSLDAGRHLWWPSKLAAKADVPEDVEPIPAQAGGQGTPRQPDLVS
ncbi:MMPL family transporter [Dactylosporangium sp. NPDC000521]|uniref:MMPL family transporter n=1 Tax=Dactylosporangium sp. NPDC000521 TaxID=3363975 RepID=UPI00367AE2D4